MRKPAFSLYAKNLMTIKLISAFVLASYIVQSLFFLIPKFQDCSQLLWLYSLVCVGPGWKPKDRFSREWVHSIPVPGLHMLVVLLLRKLVVPRPRRLVVPRPRRLVVPRPRKLVVLVLQPAVVVGVAVFVLLPIAPYLTSPRKYCMKYSNYNI